MKNLIAYLGIVVGMSFVLSTSVHAQGVTRQVVPKGDVTGLEMGIEGSMSALPGAKLRWFVTVYEVVKGRKIRPAKGVELRVQTSFHRQGPVAQATSDARGQASLIFALPTSLQGSFHLVVEARSPKGVQRNFEVQVALQQRYLVELHTEASQLSPGAQFRAWGRVIDLVTQLPVAGRTVSVQASSGADSLAQRTLETDAQGVFHTLLHAPKTRTALVVKAQTKGAKLVSRTLQTTRENTNPLQVFAQTSAAVVKPGTIVNVDVVVRRKDGRPVAGAVLSGLSIPKKSAASKDFVPVRTDRFGRARVPWKIQSTTEIEEVQGKVQALREGIGKGEGTVTIRAARAEVLVSWAVEGGALVEGLANRIVLRAFHANGEPWARLPIQLESSRIQGKAVQTNEAGLAILEVTLASDPAIVAGDCDGPTRAALRLNFEQGYRQLCLPVDPESRMRVRAATRVAAGTELSLRLLRNAGVANSPISLTLLSQSKDGAWSPVLRKVAEAGKETIVLPVPKDARGALWVRARPLLGSALQPVLGASTMTWATRGDAGRLEVIASPTGQMKLRHSGLGEGVTGFAFALPPVEGQELLERLRSEAGSRPGAGAPEEEWLGFLASKTPRDRGASAVLGKGEILMRAMPDNAVALGLLRDPWRTQARFVRGRLARVMLATQALLVKHLPHELERVALRGPAGWRFNREVISAVETEIGSDATANLDGEQLDIEEMQELAPEFIFDNVARRLTRERLLQNLVALREFVKSEQLDYQWARRGDPRGWLTALLDSDSSLEREQLYDGWGKPFAIRRAKGKRARFQFLEPIVGYELISAGPDGRFGTRDDMFDPFARILSKQSLYGHAVGEEALLARLSGVAFGRATLSALEDIFGEAIGDWQDVSTLSVAQAWRSPGKVGQSTANNVVRDFGRTGTSLSSIEPLGDTSLLTLALSPQLREYLVVGGGYGREGASFFSADTLRAGAPVHVEAVLPTRLRPQEMLQVPVQLLGLAKTQMLHMHVIGRGLEAEIVGVSRVKLAAGQIQRMELALRAHEVGAGSVTLELRTEQGKVLRRLEYKVPIRAHGSLRARHSGAVVQGKGKLKVKAPKGTAAIRSLLVVSQPQQIAQDPGFAQLRSQSPELLAWSESLRGASLVPSQLAALLSRKGKAQSMATVSRKGKASSMGVLRRACAAIAWSTVVESEEQREARARAIDGFKNVTLPVSLRERSALLVALAGGATSLAHSPNNEPVAAMVQSLRADGWHTPRTEKGHPTVLARLAAGLLLADPKDLPGRELFGLARAALGRGSAGRVLVGQGGQTVDGWIGTLALAIAARQLGEDELVEELRQSIAPRLYLGMQAEVEPAFWLLAASAYGVFGAHEATEVYATMGRARRKLRFHNGVAVVALPPEGGSVLLESSYPVMARAESRFVRPIKRISAASLEASLDGDIGSAGDVATLELLVENTGKERVGHPVVEIMLPSAAAMGRQRLLTLQSHKGVARVEPVDDSGLLRLHLKAIDGKTSIRLPLALAWIGHGKLRGLSVSTFDAAQPWLISSTPARPLSLAPTVLETW